MTVYLHGCPANNNSDEVKNMGFPMLLANTNVSFPGLGIKDLPISRIAFQIGQFPIYWYGICIILAFGACVGLAMKQARKFSLTSDHVIDFSLVIIPASLIGARLYYVAFSWKTFAADPKSIFDIRSGGLAVLGGVLMSFLAIFIMTKIRKMNSANVFDFLIVYIPLGQAIGRWGNFFNQEAFGTNTNLPWGMISAETTAYLKMYNPSLNPNLPVHPTFLYESLATILIFVILLIVRKRSKLPYATVAMYFILYGIARFFIEGLRTDSLYIGDTGLRSSQVLSAVLVVVGFGIIAVGRFLGLKRAVIEETPDNVQVNGQDAGTADTAAAQVTDTGTSDKDAAEDTDSNKAVNDEPDDDGTAGESTDESTDESGNDNNISKD